MPYEAVSFPIGGPAVYKGLIWLYSIITAYAVGVVFLGANTVGEAAGQDYARIFPVGLAFSSLAALWGVIRSRYTRTVGIEYAGTALLLAGLLSYSAALVVTSLSPEMIHRLPAALLPAAIGVFPILRMRNIIKVVKARHAEKAALKAASGVRR